MKKKTESKSLPPILSDGRCLGYWTDTPNGRDFDCEYEFAGHITCDHCMFGVGDKDPRINPDENV